MTTTFNTPRLNIQTPLLQDCSITSKVRPTALTSASQTALLKLTGGLTSEVAAAGSSIDSIVDQLKFITDCEVLTAIIKPYINQVTDVIEAAIKEQSDIASKYLPIIKLPTTPWGVISWLKKLLFGTILPQLDAFIKLAIEIIDLINSLKNLMSVISNLGTVLVNCAVAAANDLVSEVVGAVNTAINEAIDNALGPVFCQIAEISAEIDNALGVQTTQFNYNSTDSFLGSAEAAFRDKQEKINAYNNAPIQEESYVPTATFTTVDGKLLTVKDGMIVSVSNI